MKKYIAPTMKSIDLSLESNLMANSDPTQTYSEEGQNLQLSNRRNSASRNIWGEEFYY